MTNTGTAVLEPGLPQAKVVTQGTHRVRDPAATLERLTPLLHGFGITRVADVTWLDDIGIPVFQAVRPRSRALAVSQGKGLTRELAAVSAIMESVESRAAEAPPVDVHDAVAAELGLPYDVGLLARPGYEQIARHARWDWCRAHDLTGGGCTYVPVPVVSLDWTVRCEWEPPVFSSDSNGLASGNTFTEAVLSGLFEVLEREGMEYERMAVDLETITSGHAPELLRALDRASVTTDVSWFRTPLTVPVFAAHVRCPAYARTYAGYGCHLDVDVALCRALTEAAQSRATHIAGSRDDMAAEGYRWHTSPPTAEQPDVIPLATAVASCRAEAAADLNDDLFTVLGLLSGRQGPVLAVDLSPGPGVHVAKVVVPSIPQFTETSL